MDAIAFQYLILVGLMVIIGVIGVRWGSVSARSHSIDLLELPVFYTLWSVVGLGFMGIFSFVDDPKYVQPVVADLRWIPLGLWLPIVGLSGMWLGYRFGWVAFASRETPSLSLNPEGILQPCRPLVILLYVLVWPVRLWRISIAGTSYGYDWTRLGGYNQWAIYLEDSVYLILAIVALQVFSRRWSQRYLWSILSLEMVFAFIIGLTKQVLFLALVLWAAHRYSGNSFYKYRKLWVALAVTWIFMIPTSLAYRQLIDAGAISNRSLAELPGGIIESIRLSWGTDLYEAVGAFLYKVTVRQTAVTQSLGVMVSLTPSIIPYWGAERLLSIPLFVMPRVLWPEKPIVSVGEYVAVEYFDLPPDSYGSAQITMFADLYLSAGWFAVFVGMLVLGIILAFLYRFLKETPLRNGRIGFTALYISLAALSADVENTYTGLPVGLTHRLILFGLVYILCHPPFKRRNRMRS